MELIRYDVKLSLTLANDEAWAETNSRKINSLWKDARCRQKRWSTMNFEFQYKVAERKRLDRLNLPFAVGPAKFAILWCCCFIPTVLCLLWLQMWSVVIAGVGLVIAAGLVPAMARFRAAPVKEFSRQIELTPVGKREKCGTSVTFVKWNNIDEIIETKSDFLFSRNQRFSMLPKRLIEDDQLLTLRQQVAMWRNEPAASTEPTEMYRQLFEPPDFSQPWKFALQRSDLVTAVRSRIRPVDDSTFSFKDLETVSKSSRWISWIVVGLLLKLSLVMILASLPPNQVSLGPLVIFICFNPIVLLVAMSLWIRWQAARGVPRFVPEQFSIRLFEGGWGIGNEDLVAFNGWNERSTFFIAAEFIGVRTDLGLIHVMPIRGFQGRDGVWQFLDRAIRLKKTWLQKESGKDTDTQTTVVVDNEEDLNLPVNPYRSPSVKTQ